MKMTHTNKKRNTGKMVKISILVAMAFLLGFIQIPIIPIAPWLKVDLSDVPILIGAFVFGPVTGILLEFLKCLLSFLTGSQSGGVGELADFLVGLSLILPASFIYFKSKSKKTAVLGMLIGIILMIIVGILANVYILLPLYGMKMVGAKLTEYIVWGLIPFNLIKGLIISAITYVLYKKLSHSLFKVESGLTKKENLKEVTN